MKLLLGQRLIKVYVHMRRLKNINNRQFSILQNVFVNIIVKMCSDAIMFARENLNRVRKVLTQKLSVLKKVLLLVKKCLQTHFVKY